MIKDKMKQVISKKTGITSSTPDTSTGEMCIRAKQFLNSISLRRYLDAPLTDLDALMKETCITENPLYGGMYEEDKENEEGGSLRDAITSFNAEMREKYGDYFSDLEPAKEFAIWHALHLSDPNIKMGSAGGLLVLTVPGCDMGDVMPLALAASVINAAAYIALCEEGETALAEKLLA